MGRAPYTSKVSAEKGVKAIIVPTEEPCDDHEQYQECNVCFEFKHINDFYRMKKWVKKICKVCDNQQRTVRIRQKQGEKNG